MIELVQAFAEIGSQLETLMIFKMKQLHYNNALLFLYKQYYDSKLPSFTSTKYLETKDWYYAETNLANFDHLKTEDDWLKFFKQVYHDGAPQDITRCRLS